MPPDEPVERFRIEYVPVAGGKTEVVRVPECYWHGLKAYKEQVNQKSILAVSCLTLASLALYWSYDL